ncbi:MAG: response regulator transcription factor [Spirochaetes bacterium]|nr:response regulator transcription factor [Spirochaetota bacterium]
MTDNFMPHNIKIKKILIVDDHPILRQGIKRVLEKEKDLVICGEASSANEAMDNINRDKPDIAIIDITLSGNVNGIELIRSIKERFPEIYSLVLSMHSESIYAERAIKSGARGYIMKEDASKNIISAVRTVLNDELYLSGELSKKLLDKFIHKTKDSSLSIETLSNREFEIYQLVGNGFSTKEIANKLGLSIYTIESHKKNIKEKLRIKDSSELTRNAIQWVIMHHK